MGKYRVFVNVEVHNMFCCRTVNVSCHHSSTVLFSSRNTAFTRVSTTFSLICQFIDLKTFDSDYTGGVAKDSSFLFTVYKTVTGHFACLQEPTPTGQFAYCLVISPTGYFAYKTFRLWDTSPMGLFAYWTVRLLFGHFAYKAVSKI